MVVRTTRFPPDLLELLASCEGFDGCPESGRVAAFTASSIAATGPGRGSRTTIRVRDLGDLRDLCAGAVGPFQSLEAPAKFFVGSGANSVSFELDSPELLVS